MPAPSAMPPAEVDIDVELVRALLDSQCPQFASVPIEPLANGWDNAVFRLGDEHTVRLPRRTEAVDFARHEQRWLPVLASSLPLPIPAPVFAGEPGLGYPWPWSICPWLPGEMAAVTPPAVPEEAARAVGEFIAALAQPAPLDAPHNPYRGVPLAERSAGFDRNVARLAGRADMAVAAALWRELVAVPSHDGAPVWVHGDLHPANMLVESGRLSAVIDFGDITAGDPATDLSVAWMLLPPAARPALRDAAGGCDDTTWARARGNALAHAVACIANSADNPLIAGVGERTLAAVLADG